MYIMDVLSFHRCDFILLQPSQLRLKLYNTENRFKWKSADICFILSNYRDLSLQKEIKKGISYGQY